MKIIIFDFEVFKYDVLLGAYVIEENDKTLFQSWDKEEIKSFYYDNIESIWIGHNNADYDNLILEAIVNDKDPYKISKMIINQNIRPRTRLKLYYFDLMKQTKSPYGLKSTELYVGKNISETQVDFDLDRPLTNNERALTESYNRDDVEQTYDNFIEMSSTFKMRLDILKEFKLPLDYLSVTGTKIAAIVLGANKIDGIENMPIKPKIYDSLRLKNKQLIDYYLNEDFRTDKKLSIEVCGAVQQIGQGGIHSAIEHYHTKKALYFDVSGYYNLIMINYDLLPRTLPAKSKQLYEQMYHEQLRLKKIDPVKRGVYKTILLSVFGAMMNQYTDFYDPQKGLLVTITGQLFAVDLMEKLEGLAKIVQSNTDGIIVEPYDWNDEAKIFDIVDEWCARTGFVIKKEHIYDIWQRDVNCYCYKNEDGDIHVVGEAVRLYGQWEHMFLGNFFDSKEPAIFAYAIVDYLINGISPEETIEKYKRELRMFQYSAKKKSFDWTQLEESNMKDNSVSITKLQGTNRVFASNNKEVFGQIYKCRTDGKVKKTKCPNLPDNVFVWDDDIISNKKIDILVNKIDYNYYVQRAYEKILTFLED